MWELFDFVAVAGIVLLAMAGLAWKWFGGPSRDIGPSESDPVLKGALGRVMKKGPQKTVSAKSKR